MRTTVPARAGMRWSMEIDMWITGCLWTTKREVQKCATAAGMCPGRGRFGPLPGGLRKYQPPVLVDEITAVRRLALLALQDEPGTLVQAAGAHEDVVGEEDHLAVPGPGGEPHALVDQPATDAHPADLGL